MQHLDLFSGIGGFALAARWAGIETIAFCERDNFCQQVLSKHWPDVIIYPDVRSMTYSGKIDLLTAGFPCQPFSIAGKQKGKDDDRYLWPELKRIIRKSKPTWCILENVPGIIPMLDPILEDLEKENYSWRAYLIPASAMGAPHKRERLWIIANSNSEQCYKMAAYSDAVTKRFERQNITTEIGNAVSNSDSKSKSQNNSFIESNETTWPRYSRTDWNNQSIFNWEKNEPPVPGVDDGLPNGLDRNKSLGNAIVPQIAYIFMKIIVEIEGGIYGSNLKST